MSTIIQAIYDTLAVVSRTLPVIGITLIVMEVLSALGVFQRVQYFFIPLVRLARLPGTSGPALMTAIGSPLTADTLIAADHRAGRLDHRQTLLAAQANTLPSYITETFTYMVPVMLPALGRKPGMIYLTGFLLTGVIKFFLIITIGRCSGSLSKPESPVSGHTAKQALSCRIIQSAFLRGAKTLFRISLILIPATLLTTLALRAGLLSNVVRNLKPFLYHFGLPESVVIPILGFTASPMAGAAAIGTLFKGGAVDANAAGMAALLGSLLALPVFALRYSWVRNISIFGPGLGTLNTLISVGIGMASRLMVIIFLMTGLIHGIF